MESLSIRVLLADDEAAIRNGLQNAISWEHYQAQVIATASNGQEALDLIGKYRPDLVVIDIKMPQIDGLEVIRRSKAAGFACRFLILSGYDDFSLAQKAIRYGANGYFLKPLKVEEFKDELSRQCTEILSSHHTPAASANLSELMESSKIFFLNQLLLNEIRDDSELTRRRMMLGLTILDAPFRLAVCAAAVSKSNLLPALCQAKPVFANCFGDRPCEIWILGEKQLIFLIAEPSVSAEHIKHVASFEQAARLESSTRSEQASPQDILAPLADGLRQLKEQTGIRFYAAVGTSATHPDQAAASYSAALRALSYHIYECPTDIYDDSMVCRTKPSFSTASIAYDPMIACIEHANPDEIEQCCTSFVQSLFFVPMPPPDFIRGMCIHVLTNIRVRFLAKHPDLTLDEPIRPDDVLSCHTTLDLIHWLMLGFSSISERYLQKKESSDPIIETAKEYIKNHISSNLKARDVAATVNLSESYFTIYFKTKAGQNFRDYVLNARTDLARKLLLERRLSISEIAYATGYQDYRSFSRAFKNVTGISPSDYQNR